MVIGRSDRHVDIYGVAKGGRLSLARRACQKLPGEVLSLCLLRTGAGAERRRQLIVGQQNGDYLVLSPDGRVLTPLPATSLPVVGPCTELAGPVHGTRDREKPVAAASVRAGCLPECGRWRSAGPG